MEEDANYHQKVLRIHRDLIMYTSPAYLVYDRLIQFTSELVTDRLDKTITYQLITVYSVDDKESFRLAQKISLGELEIGSAAMARLIEYVGLKIYPRKKNTELDTAIRSRIELQLYDKIQPIWKNTWDLHHQH